MSPVLAWLLAFLMSIASLLSTGRADALPASTSPMAPKIFHAPDRVHAGDIMPIQGANLGSVSAYYLSKSGVPSTLQIVNRVGDTWLAVQLPSPLPTGFAVYLQNASGTSSLLRLTGAAPKHLDSTRIVPGGRFRVFGLDLLLAGVTPSVTVGGLRAAVDITASTEHMLAVTAPPALVPGVSVTVAADNGDGSGPDSLPIEVPVVAGFGDPLGLEVGWAAGFTFFNHVITAHPVCNGSADDTWAIESAVIQASQSGGGVVQLPAGTCRITSTVNLASRVVLRGMGQDLTILRYEGNYPIYAYNFRLVGMQDLQLLNSGPVQEGAIWQQNNKSFIKRVTFNMGVSRQMFLTSNRDFLFDHNVIRQTGSYNQQNPFLFNQSSGLIFSYNHVINSAGSPTFQYVHDAAFFGNEFTRDASSQYESPVTAHHGFVADFSYRISLIGNTFDVINGPITNKNRNDGETFLVEGGGGSRTENLGSVKSATSGTLTDQANVINVDPFGTGTIPENYGVAIVAGKGMGQRRRVTAYANSTLTIDKPWDVVPDTTSRYSTFVWALEDAMLIGNVLTDNPRGIWLYQSSVRNVVISGNKISEGGGIFIRSYQNRALRLMTVQDDITVQGNSVQNTMHRWLSYIDLADVSSDPKIFGTGQTNILILRNLVVANSPNLTSNVEDYAGREGYTALMHIEPSGGQVNAAVPNLLGTVIQSNVCQNCAQPYMIGTGDFGTSLVANQPSTGAAGLADRALLGTSNGASAFTFKP